MGWLLSQREKKSLRQVGCLVTLLLDDFLWMSPSIRMRNWVDTFLFFPCSLVFYFILFYFTFSLYFLFFISFSRSVNTEDYSELP